jgi:hypothetical protein
MGCARFTGVADDGEILKFRECFLGADSSLTGTGRLH